MDDNKLRWWSIHVQNFLATVGRHQWQGAISDLAERFLDELRHATPSVPDWRQRQVRQALEVFARGVENWHFEAQADGRVRPVFRLKTAAAGASQTPAPPPPKPQGSPVLSERPWRERMVATLRLKNYSHRTERAYLDWVERFLRFHGTDNPRTLGEAQIREFLEYLAVVQNVSASTQNQAFSGLLFLYQSVLEYPLGDLRDTVRARRPARLPVVLSQEEVKRLLGAMEGTLQLMARLLYGTGLRVMEGVRLRIKDLDFDRGQILVREGKGGNYAKVVVMQRFSAGTLI